MLSKYVARTRYRVVPSAILGKWDIVTRTGDHYCAQRDTKAEAVRWALETESEIRIQEVRRQGGVR